MERRGRPVTAAVASFSLSVSPCAVSVTHILAQRRGNHWIGRGRAAAATEGCLALNPQQRRVRRKRHQNVDQVDRARPRGFIVPRSSHKR